MDHPSTSSLTRREVLRLGSAALAIGAASPVLPTPGRRRPRPRSAAARFRLRHHVAPVHFDPHQTIAFSTMIPLSFAYSRLVKVKGGSAVVPGTQPDGGRPRGVLGAAGRQRLRVQAPEGRPLAQQAARQRPGADRRGRPYTYDRFLTIKGNGNKYILEMVDKVEALDKYTVKFTLREPNAWFLDRLASTSTWIIAKECVDQYGDLKKPESVVGTGPWMFQSSSPASGSRSPATPTTSSPGCPTRTAWTSRSPRIPRRPSPSSCPASSTSAPSTAW